MKPTSLTPLKILFVTQRQSLGLASFMERDLRILQTIHDVRMYEFRGLQDTHDLFWAVQWCDVTFSWFGKLHAFFTVLFSRIFGKSSIVIAGGDDVMTYPKFGYGLLAQPLKRWCPLFVFRYSDLILPVSKIAMAQAIRSAKADPSRVALLYHGFEPDRWKRIEDIEKQRVVLTVGELTRGHYQMKRLDLLVRAARHLPDAGFFIVGPCDDGSTEFLRILASENVGFTGGLYGGDLIKMYSMAKVYALLSVTESFGCSIAEAMLCECIPVVSSVGAIPEVVGDCGYYVDSDDPQEIARMIQKALSNDSDLGKRARERIVREFPFSRRHHELLRHIDEVSKTKRRSGQ